MTHENSITFDLLIRFFSDQVRWNSFTIVQLPPILYDLQTAVQHVYGLFFITFESFDLINSDATSTCYFHAMMHRVQSKKSAIRMLPGNKSNAQDVIWNSRWRSKLEEKVERKRSKRAELAGRTWQKSRPVAKFFPAQPSTARRLVLLLLAADQKRLRLKSWKF